jgi:hypothetical protein
LIIIVLVVLPEINSSAGVIPRGDGIGYHAIFKPTGLPAMSTYTEAGRAIGSVDDPPMDLFREAGL